MANTRKEHLTYLLSKGRIFETGPGLNLSHSKMPVELVDMINSVYPALICLGTALSLMKSPLKLAIVRSAISGHDTFLKDRP
ncbi:MAG: hypothetical protein K5908_04985 [Erysipelotrichaceae bacterium]|nr:hypothetical protein [Erysipelotrichaceae bacterium]